MFASIDVIQRISILNYIVFLKELKVYLAILMCQLSCYSYEFLVIGVHVLSCIHMKTTTVEKA